MPISVSVSSFCGSRVVARGTGVDSDVYTSTSEVESREGVATASSVPAHERIASACPLKCTANNFTFDRIGARSSSRLIEAPSDAKESDATGPSSDLIYCCA